MRREEAEQEAARRNRSDQRRIRLEFYAFDASAGLAEDAWEVTMRLRREPLAEPATVAGSQRAPRRTAEPEAAEAYDMEGAARRAERRSARTRERAAPGPRPRRRTAERRPAVEERPEAKRRQRLRRRKERAEELAPRPRRPLLVRLARFVGSTVILVAVLWVGLITALVVLVHATSFTGLAIYVGAIAIGLVAIWLGFAIRRA